MKFYQVVIYTVTLVTSINTYADSKLDVLADSCDNLMQNYSNLNCGQSCEEYLRQNYPHCFPMSGPSENSIHVTLFGHAQAISNIISNRFLRLNRVSTKKSTNDDNDDDLKTTKSTTSGMSSGSEFTKWNVWGGVNRNETEQSFGGTKQIDFDTTIATGLLGGDYTLSPTMVVGISVSINKGDGSMAHINGSSLMVSENHDNDNFAIAPYFGMQLSPELSLDISLGIGRGELDTSQHTENKYNSWFTGTNLSYVKWLDEIQLSGKISYMHGEESYNNSTTNGIVNSNTANTNKIDQIRLGVQAGYWINEFMPYVSLAYSSDVSREYSQLSLVSGSTGKNAWIWAIGVDILSLSNNITGGISFTKEEGRDHQDHQAIAGNISILF